jgi:hypothetical protein
MITKRFIQYLPIFFLLPLFSNCRAQEGKRFTEAQAIIVWLQSIHSL